MSRPFVITVASEKGGVGKTTIATNLAVYLKALREELPVTIASFDNHFSVDQMFALGPKPQRGIEGLLDDAWTPDCVTLGQYGVQYIASARRLHPPAQPPTSLSQRLLKTELQGALILDTRPILDWFTEAAVLAADLVLVPVKDRAALVNAAALRQVLDDAGRSDRLWLVPSLVDARARLNPEVRVHEFLRYAADERDYQVVDLYISKSPKVESLASGFSSRIMPVLTHARQTAVHGQLKELAEFVLVRYTVTPKEVSLSGTPFTEDFDRRRTVSERRRLPECPVCQSRFTAHAGHYFFALRQRRHGFVHSDCYAELFAGIELAELVEEEGTIALSIDGPGLLGPEAGFTAHLFDATGALVMSETVQQKTCRALRDAVAMMLGGDLDQSYRDLLLIRPLPIASAEQLSPQGLTGFRKLRRHVLRELRTAGMI